MSLAAIEIGAAADDEVERLAALHALELLDTGFEQRFDDLTELARRVFDVPIALISLVDAGRQWFKSRQGLDVAETPRNISFCTHAIRGEAPFVVSDARCDPRFRDNPLVVGPHHIRFYAGVPLRPNSGPAIGTLCIIDRRRRNFSNNDERQLSLLAQLVCGEIEARALRHRLSRERAVRAEVESVVEQRNVELSQAASRAAVADRAKTNFLHNMGHELRTPLNAILGFADLMKSGVAGACSEAQRQYLNFIEGSGQQLLEVVNQVLEMSQLELGGPKFEIQALDVHDAVRAAAGGIGQRALRGGIALSCMVEPDLPLVAADQRAFRRALSNVLDNAVKFTAEGGSIEITSGTTEDGVVVTVSDSGVGIPADKLAVVCEPFTQVDQGLARRFEGAGLGLAIAKGLIEAQGGSLTIESVLGEGTTVAVVLPFAQFGGANPSAPP